MVASTLFACKSIFMLISNLIALQCTQIAIIRCFSSSFIYSRNFVSVSIRLHVSIFRKPFFETCCAVIFFIKALSWSDENLAGHFSFSFLYQDIDCPSPCTQNPRHQGFWFQLLFLLNSFLVISSYFLLPQMTMRLRVREKDDRKLI